MIKLENIDKTFGQKRIFNQYNLTIKKGDFIAVTGKSGAGKTTLLNLAGLLEEPTDGDIIVENKKNPSKKEIMYLQRHHFGYLFQNYALIENTTVEKNLKIALAYQRKKQASFEIEEALKKVNLAGYQKKKIFELSGGEQQRVALARVIVKDASYIFADEPTGNLDRENRDIVFSILKDLNREGRTVVFVTHDLELAEKADTVISL
ncbi:putative ABC transport system ATP-binding protein [Scopulibacillus daqui]|uniref:ABC transport system ATP-binding protein n=1 Tax=Scopulibacillus daqui TaxID=1469162 RepID=A0ABS2Q123_9BACL|nr:putative bacteriocin export ABC transporter [Scopulibacillus daqui]MBM7645993.1 putative ABC transport system ATP-binding protein [Scopulibacillus daqui]